MENINIRKLAEDDIQTFVGIVAVFEDVFSMNNFVMPPRDHLQQLLQQKGFFVFVATDSNDEVVGGLTAYTLIQYYSTRPLVYIYDLAVKHQMQRQGIGTMLMNAIIDYCTNQGMEEVFVQADVVDQHAVDFYAATGGIPENVIHFYYPLNGR